MTRTSQPGAIEVVRSRALMLAQACSVLTLVAVAVVLLGWVQGWEWAKRVHVGYTSMKVNTALLFAASAIGAWIVARRPQSNWPERIGVAVALLATVTLAQTVFGFDAGVDQWLMSDPEPGLRYPGRMAPASSVAFAALGVGLAVRRRGPLCWQPPTLLALFVGLLSLCGYLYGAHGLYTIGGVTSVAGHTAALFVCVSLSVLLSQPGRGVTFVIVTDTRVGRTLRRVVPVIAIVPPTLGWLCMRGHQLNYYDANFAFALIVLANMTSVTFTALLAGMRVHVAQSQDAADQALLMGLGALLGSRGDPDETLRAAVQFVGQAFGATRCVIHDIDLQHGRAAVRARYEPEQSPLPGTWDMSADPADAYNALRAGLPVVNADTARDPSTASRYARDYRPNGVGASVSIPLLWRGEWAATFSVISDRPRAWQSREVTLIQHVAQHTWAWYVHRQALVERERLLEELKQLTQGLERRVEERTAALSTALREKDVLIKEIHHRVKNNLQVISSLLNLQSTHVPDLRSRTMLRETQARVQSIALVHEKLYQAKDLSQIDVREYVRPLVHGLLHSLDAEQRGIQAVVEVSDVYLPVDLAVPCGMIINELVTNALKHAFAPGQPGQVRVSMKLHDRARVELVVADNGRGMPEDVDPRRTTSLGLELVFAFADQIGATVSYRREEGTAFCLVFPRGATHATGLDSAHATHDLGC